MLIAGLLVSCRKPNSWVLSHPNCWPLGIYFSDRPPQVWNKVDVVITVQSWEVFMTYLGLPWWLSGSALEQNL
ncbi:hypothetical protein CapIbe_003713 [Capra ibex]